jgi:hypothetical protein
MKTTIIVKEIGFDKDTTEYFVVIGYGYGTEAEEATYGTYEGLSGGFTDFRIIDIVELRNPETGIIESFVDLQIFSRTYRLKKNELVEIDFDKNQVILNLEDLE